jgi:hypothetical protein
MREHHDAEEPAEGGEAHEQRNQDRPPKNTPRVFLLGKTPTTVRTVLVSIAQKSDLHGIIAKILIFIIKNVQILQDWLNLKSKFCE